MSKKKIPMIIRGEDKQLTINITSKATDLPLDLTDATEIIVAFNKEDGTSLLKKKTDNAVTIVSAEGGRIQVTLAEGDTALLALGYDDNFEDLAIEIQYGEVTKRLNAVNCIQVAPPVVELD